MLTSLLSGDREQRFISPCPPVLCKERGSWGMDDRPSYSQTTLDYHRAHCHRQLLQVLEDEGGGAVVDTVVEVEDLLETGLGGLVLGGHTVRTGVQLILGRVEVGQD